MEKKKRGRPPIGDKALTSLESNRKNRARLKKLGSVTIQIILTKSVVEIVDCYIGVDGATRAKVVQNWLTSWAIDAALGGEPSYSKTLVNKIVEEENQLNQTQEVKNT